MKINLISERKSERLYFLDWLRILAFSILLRYFTQAVYPFYILHQTVIVSIGFFVIQLEGSIFYKLSLMTGLSFGLIFLVYEFIIRKTVITRVIFGLKAIENKKLLVISNHDCIAAAPVEQELAQVAPDLPETLLSEMDLKH